MSETNDQRSTRKEGKKTDAETDRTFNLDTDGIELLPADATPESANKLPGQFDEHEKTLDTLKGNWTRIDSRKWVRRQQLDRRLELRFGGRDRRLAKFDRRRDNRGWNRQSF